nr:MAG: DNA pilot protein [Microvirus sp.]
MEGAWPPSAFAPFFFGEPLMGLFDGLAGGLLSGIMGMFGQDKTNDMQQQMMAQQQSFQERMSSTAYQRASSDMTAAGLNPMMMFGSGSASSTPAGASPSPSVKSGFDSDALQKAVSTSTQMRVADATIDNLVEQNAKIKAEAATELRRPALVGEQTVATARSGEKSAADTYKVREGEMPILRSKGDILRNEAITSKNEEKMNGDARRLLDIGGYAGKRSSQILSPVTDIVSSARGVRSLFSDRFHY